MGELERLSIQARLIAPITRGFLLDGGIAPGMRVLDVGSGAGDVAFLVAELVGVIVFHEPDRDGIRSFPPVPLYDRCCKLLDETVRRWGGDPRMGINLYRTFIAAGLPAPRMRLESVIAGGQTALIRSISRWT
jgi:hypothetical protein